MNGSSSKKQKRKKTVIMRKRTKAYKAHRNFKFSSSRWVHKREVGGGENPIDIGSERPPRK